MAKMSMLVCLFLFVLIAMPTSSSSRMMLPQDPGLVETKCTKLVSDICSDVTGCRGACPTLECPNAYYVEKCCNCKVCC
ncbi:hypothetical protein C5167_021814 [Papaver somniferum]|uniref:Uncharacterized protein n=1 Tax=Papaver somniferum TaxID=3469 RepID=A0A4Y7JK62_PAPSO|nr:hypothetical protein C5167_021814 [Papaver somniferum]